MLHSLSYHLLQIANPWTTALIDELWKVLDDCKTGVLMSTSQTIYKLSNNNGVVGDNGTRLIVFGSGRFHTQPDSDQLIAMYNAAKPASWNLFINQDTRIEAFEPKENSTNIPKVLDIVKETYPTAVSIIVDGTGEPSVLTVKFPDLEMIMIGQGAGNSHTIGEYLNVTDAINFIGIMDKIFKAFNGTTSSVESVSSSVDPVSSSVESVSSNVTDSGDFLKISLIFFVFQLFAFLFWLG